MTGHNAKRDESLPTWPFAPGEPPKSPATPLDPEVLDAERIAASTTELVQRPDLRARGDGDAEVEAEHPHGVSERARAAESGIGEHDLARDLVVDRARDEVERQVELRLEHEVDGDPRLLPSRGVVGPRLGHVESEVDRDVLVLRRDRQAHADLAVADLSEGARVLALHAHRVLPLLRKARVVDDPGRDRLLLLQFLDDVPRSLPPHASVVPRAVPEEVEEPSLHALAQHPGLYRRVLVVASRRARRDGLDALALAVSQDAVRVQRERLLLLASRKVTPDPGVEKLSKPALHRAVVRERHGRAQCTYSSRMDITN